MLSMQQTVSCWKAELQILESLECALTILSQQGATLQRKTPDVFVTLMQISVEHSMMLD